MTPIRFPECNVRYGPPEGFSEAQVKIVHAYEGPVEVGSCDGAKIVVVAHIPTPEDLARLNAGEPIYLTMMGGLAPHFLTTRFVEAINPA